MPLQLEMLIIMVLQISSGVAQIPTIVPLVHQVFQYFTNLAATCPQLGASCRLSRVPMVIIGIQTKMVQAQGEISKPLMSTEMVETT